VHAGAKTGAKADDEETRRLSLNYLAMKVPESFKTRRYPLPTTVKLPDMPDHNHEWKRVNELALARVTAMHDVKAACWDQRRLLAFPRRTLSVLYFWNRLHSIYARSVYTLPNRLTLIYGPMNAGKTRSLLESYRRSTESNCTPVLLRPSCDTRCLPVDDEKGACAKKDTLFQRDDVTGLGGKAAPCGGLAYRDLCTRVVSRDGQWGAAIRATDELLQTAQFYHDLQEAGYAQLYLDEGQFLSATAAQCLLENAKLFDSVVISCLDTDYRRVEWPAFTLWSKAKRDYPAITLRLSAHVGACCQCGGVAEFTRRDCNVPARIVVDNADTIYSTVCIRCWSG
jgi:thymidine kinase